MTVITKLALLVLVVVGGLTLAVNTHTHRPGTVVSTQIDTTSTTMLNRATMHSMTCAELSRRFNSIANINDPWYTPLSLEMIGRCQ